MDKQTDEGRMSAQDPWKKISIMDEKVTKDIEILNTHIHNTHKHTFVYTHNSYIHIHQCTYNHTDTCLYIFYILHIYTYTHIYTYIQRIRMQTYTHIHAIMKITVLIGRVF